MQSLTTSLISSAAHDGSQRRRHGALRALQAPVPEYQQALALGHLYLRKFPR
jgi:hypothetical protein